MGNRLDIPVSSNQSPASSGAGAPPDEVLPDVSPAIGLPPGHKYWAFISYSHSDEASAKWLHMALETYQVPRQLVGRTLRGGTVPRRLVPIFRDRDELAGAAELRHEIQQALRRSLYLVVICSPLSALSKYVNEEIKVFKALGREDRVLCLIVEGEPNASDEPGTAQLECFPPSIRFRVDALGALTDVRTEPAAADARKAKDGKRNAKLKLLAGILDISFDQLRRREHRRAVRRRLWLSLVSLVALALSLIGYAGLADAGVGVPGGTWVRLSLDRHGSSVFRPVPSDEEIREAALGPRKAAADQLLRVWTNGNGWLLPTPSRKDRPRSFAVWDAGQAFAALLGSPIFLKSSGIFW